MDGPSTGSALEALLENHRAFLSYLERRVGDRALADRRDNGRAYRRGTLRRRPSSFVAIAAPRVFMKILVAGRGLMDPPSGKSRSSCCQCLDGSLALTTTRAHPG